VKVLGLGFRKRVIFKALWESRISFNRAKEILRIDIGSLRREYKIYAKEKEEI
jgi:hypothetical protein